MYFASSLRLSAEMLIVEKFEAENKLNEALEEIKKIETNMANSGNPFAQNFMGGIA
jgi:hypothetical protein